MTKSEVHFTLPRGYMDESGVVHKSGCMRLATVADEIHLIADPRVKKNRVYLSVLLLARVIKNIGSVNKVTPLIIEQMFVSDMEYLQELYMEINHSEGVM